MCSVLAWCSLSADEDLFGQLLSRTASRGPDLTKVYDTGWAFEEGCKKYTHARPFTKESLLYRDIFEKHYPGQSEMVADFWMPNRNWEGCDVQDPSARVLSNYGASGV